MSFSDSRPSASFIISAAGDAYLNAGQTDKAISLYESSLSGAFEENEHVRAQLSIAYFTKQRYEDMRQTRIGRTGVQDHERPLSNYPSRLIAGASAPPA
jgi:hypothetical protein